MSTLIRLYPRAWRERYEAEFLGILQARPPSRRDRLDIVRGALDARLHPEVPGPPDASGPRIDAARRAGVLAIVAGLACLGWIGLILRDFRGWGAGQPESAGLMISLSAVAFLSLAAAHVLLAVAGQSSMRRFGAAGAYVAAVSFPFMAFGGGWALAIGLIGSVVLAGAMAGRTISGWLSAVWIVASLLLLVVMIAFIGSGGQNVGLFVFGAPFGLAWLLVGLAIARRGVPSGTTVADESG